MPLRQPGKHAPRGKRSLLEQVMLTVPPCAPKDRQPDVWGASEMQQMGGQISGGVEAETAIRREGESIAHIHGPSATQNAEEGGGVEHEARLHAGRVAGVRRVDVRQLPANQRCRDAIVEREAPGKSVGGAGARAALPRTLAPGEIEDVYGDSRLLPSRRYQSHTTSARARARARRAFVSEWIRAGTGTGEAPRC